MTFLEKQNIGGTDYRVQSIMPVGACATPAGSEVKVCTFSDDFALVAGAPIMVQFTYANTYGDGSTTYPKLQINGTNYPVINLTGTYATNGAWVNGQKVSFTFDGTNFVIAGDLETTRTITTGTTSVAGAVLGNGRTIRIMFTADITGSDTTTGMTITYNGTSYPVMAGSNGSLRALVAVNVSGTYKYVQAYTTLELMFDGTQLIVIGNPVVVSNSDYTVYADGQNKSNINLLNDIDNSKFSLTTADVPVTAQCSGLLYLTLNAENAEVSTSYIYEDNIRIQANDAFSRLDDNRQAYYRTFTILIRKGKSYKFSNSEVSVYSSNFIPFN